MTRIAVVKKNKCNPITCGNYLCIRLCPVNRMEEECIVRSPDNKVFISEELCTGCGICVNRCPTEAISIINLPEELDKEPIHRYGRNMFALYNMPVPIPGKVVGIIGRNGIGKSTAVKILAGILKPNLGKEEASEKGADWKDIIAHFKGTEAQAFFEKMRDGKISLSYKPQTVDDIPKQYKGKVKDLLKKVDEKKQLKEMAEALELTMLLDHEIGTLSGGELQRVAIAAASLKKAEVYFFDEPTSYLDSSQRLKVSGFIRKLADEGASVVVIEHDLIVLDAMTDLIHVMYGQEGTYGVVSQPKAAKAGINIYLTGYLREENVRFRDHQIQFFAKPARDSAKFIPLTEWPAFQLKLGEFTLDTTPGKIGRGESIGIVGKNGIGKTTFVKTLAGVIPTEHALSGFKVAYKAQYLQASDELVISVLHNAIQKYEVQLMRPLDLKGLLMRKLNELSGGELQRVAIAHCLSQEADIYLLDEPSAYLDVEQRLVVSKVIKDMISLTGRTALIVDHDILFLDYLSDKLLVFSGEPARHGTVEGPYNMEEGMNKFLTDLDITFRRDDENRRPRANKLESQMDKEQKKTGKRYYA